MHAQKSESKHLSSCNMVPWVLFEPRQCRKTCVNILLIKVGLMSVGHVRTQFQENLCLNPNLIRKRYAHLVYCIVGLKVNLNNSNKSESKGPLPLNLSA